MMKIRLMQDDGTRMLHRHLVYERVMRIITELIDDRVVIRGIKPGRLLRERVYLCQAGKVFEDGSGIIGDAAASRRQWREERDPHSLDCRRTVEVSGQAPP